MASEAGNRVVVRALDNVSFAFEPGDRVGLVGHNGAGKTTLLRVLSGVYAPVSGTVTVAGRMVSLLDLSLGMEAESTGYENIFLRGALMGMPTREIEERLEDIAEFSELGDYLNMPVRTYSSGMLLRLAFSVCTTVTADIVLMDEWLSVGDAAFNMKASERLDAMVRRSSILVLASHSRELIQKNCNRVFELSHGSVVESTESQQA